MVKQFLLFLLILLHSSSCCDYYMNSMTGLRSKRKYQKYISKRVNPSVLGIDTNSVYKLLNRKYDEETKTIVKDIFKSKKIACLLFRKNGNCYSFFGLNNLSRNSINPAKGIINYLTKRKNKEYNFVSYSPINCGSFSKDKLKVKGDTLMISAGSKKGYRIWYYYLKQQIPKE